MLLLKGELFALMFFPPTFFQAMVDPNGPPPQAPGTPRTPAPPPQVPVTPGTQAAAAPTTPAPAPTTPGSPPRKRRKTNLVIDFLTEESRKEQQYHEESEQKTERFLSLFEKLIDKF